MSEIKLPDPPITVAVFPVPHRSPIRKSGYTAYTLWYNPTWPGCCIHKVYAVNGAAAKGIAIRDHLDRCVVRARS